MPDIEIKHYIDSLHYDLELTAKYTKTLGIQILEKFNPDIPIDCFVALDTIFCNPGICQRDLAKLILKDRANTGRALEILEKAGYIERYNDTKNNRLVRKMEITEDGKQFLQKSTEYFRPIKDQIDTIISAEEEKLVRDILKKLREGIENLIEKQI